MGLVFCSIPCVRAGLEFIGFGYLLNSGVCFAMGGFLLTVFAPVSWKREGGWQNILWFCLNGPFGLVGLCDWMLDLSAPLSWLNIFQLAIVVITGTVGVIITYISFRYPSVNLNGCVETIAADAANGKSA